MPFKSIPDNAFGLSSALRRKVHRIQEAVFRRTFALPAGVTRDQVDTRFKGDVLTVTIPRSV